SPVPPAPSPVAGGGAGGVVAAPARPVPAGPPGTEPVSGGTTTAPDQPAPTESPSATPLPSPSPSPAPPVVPPLSYGAEASANSLAGTRTYSCAPCSGGRKVGQIGYGTGALTFNKVNAVNAGTVTVTIAYVNGDLTRRRAQLSVDGGTPVWFSF